LNQSFAKARICAGFMMEFSLSKSDKRFFPGTLSGSDHLNAPINTSLI